MRALAMESEVLTACFACGWVHGFPWRCPSLSRQVGDSDLLLPRGIFFDSKLFAALNATSYDPNSPLAGATVYGNDNKGIAHLNSRLIQLVITKNATLAQAWKIVDLAATNTTGTVTAFALMVTNEFYTLGLAKEVRDLTANTVVENSGNATAPPPSPEWWEKAWNALAGFGQWLWNGAVAVAVFFVSVGKWLVDIGIGLYKGLVEQNWTYFKQNVLEPLRKAIEAFIELIKQVVTEIFTAALSGILNGLKGVAGSTFGGTVSQMQVAARESPTSPEGSQAITIAIESILSLVGLFAALPAIIRGLEVVAAAASMGFSWLLSKIVSKAVANFVVKALAWTALSLTITAVLTEVSAAAGWLEEATSKLFDSLGVGTALIAGAAEVAFKLFEKLSTKVVNQVSVIKRFGGFGLALFGLLFSVLGAVYTKGPTLALIDFVSALLAFGGLVTYLLESRKPEAQAMDLLSSFSTIFESLVSYGSLPVIGAQVGIHLAKGDYN